MKVNFKEVSIIIAVACIMAVVYNSFSIAGVSYIYKQEKVFNGTVISVKQAKDMVEDSDILFIDARSESSYKVAHLPRSLNVPYNSKDLDKLISGISKDQNIVVYCYSKRCNMARMLAAKLSTLEFTHVAVFDDGISEWTKNKLPVESSIEQNTLKK